MIQARDGEGAPTASLSCPRTEEPSSVLEVACGTGVVTRALAAGLSAACEIVETDLNAGMRVTLRAGGYDPTGHMA